MNCICRKSNGRNVFARVEKKIDSQEKNLFGKEGKKVNMQEKIYGKITMVNNMGDQVEDRIKQVWSKVGDARIGGNDKEASTSNPMAQVNELEKVSNQKNEVVNKQRKQIQIRGQTEEEQKERGSEEISRQADDIADEVKKHQQQQNNQNQEVENVVLDCTLNATRPTQKEKESQNSEQVSGNSNSAIGSEVSTKQISEEIKQQQHRILTERDSIGLSDEEISYNSLMEAENSLEKQNKKEIECLGPCTLNMENSCHSSNDFGSPPDEREVEEKSNEKEVEDKSNEELKGGSEEEYQLYVGKNNRKKKGNGSSRTRGGSKRNQWF